MRLLTLGEHGDLPWREFSQDTIPPYAILSHTWGAEEVSFHDLVKDNGRSKAGRRKIVFCGEQADRDGLRYFWVDTCCIDKQNNTELTKAINSMFRWYRNAAKCYVYLSDVSTSTSDPDAETCRSAWEADFRRSKWFTRGWTLQELLAPLYAEFYSSQHQRLGNKQSLAGLIHDITRIPIPALHGHPLDKFSVDERRTWAANRQTTEPEDVAYCLFGIFDVSMPLVYGEGKSSAMKRLRKEIEEAGPVGRSRARPKQILQRPPLEIWGFWLLPVLTVLLAVTAANHYGLMKVWPDSATTQIIPKILFDVITPVAAANPPAISRAAGFSKEKENAMEQIHKELIQDRDQPNVEGMWYLKQRYVS
jgi:hypothetical protein